LPADEIERLTGSQQVPTNSSLEAMLIREEQEEMLAVARNNPTNVEIQLPDQKAEKNDAPAYVRTGADANAVSKTTDADVPSLKPIDSGMKTLKLNETADVVRKTDPVVTDRPGESAAPTAELSIQNIPEMKAGERAKVAVTIKGGSDFLSAVLGLKFDTAKVAIRSVTLGSAFGTAENAARTPFLNQKGKMYISLEARDANATAGGTLAYIEIEALADGKPVIVFDRDVLNLLTSDGKNFSVKVFD
jgi:hypothetical protein